MARLLICSGNLFCSAKMDNALLKITPDKNVTGFFREDGFLPLGLAFHKNGRLYALCTSGRIISMDAEGENIEYLETIYHGKTACPNDLVFDSRGNLYVTDFSGHVGNPIGGVYRYSEEFQQDRVLYWKGWRVQTVSDSIRQKISSGWRRQEEANS